MPSIKVYHDRFRASHDPTVFANSPDFHDLFHFVFWNSKGGFETRPYGSLSIRAARRREEARLVFDALRIA